MHIVLGIGNPGAEYQRTRHNIGFEVIEALVERWGKHLEKHKKWKSLQVEHRLPADYQAERVLAMQPQTYVNLSGISAQAACTFYKAPPAQLLVVVDDLNLPLGTLRFREGGSAGGHNGLKDISARLGPNYPRLRVGIGAPTGDQVGFVLGKWAPNEVDDVHAMTAKAADCVAAWLQGGVTAAMRFNGPLHAEQPKPKPSIAVIDYGSEDYRAALALREAVLRQPLGLTLSAEDLADEDQQVHLVLRMPNGDLAGTAVLRPLADGVVQLRQMAVAESARGQGLGQRLARAAEGQAKKRGWRVVELAARAEAVGFYRKLGYRFDGEPYQSLGIEHQRMRRRLVKGG